MRIIRKQWLLAALALMILALAAPASAAPTACGGTHVVQRGETMYSIARRYDVSVWTIARANGMTNPNRIYVGQRLVIPCYRQTTGHVHIVQAGENLTTIGLRYGVSAWAIARANGLTNLNHIYAGQRLTIPGAGATPTKKPTSVPTHSPVSFPGPWTGEYFDNASLSGEPCRTRTDEAIDFNWAYGPPADCMPTNHFSVRWTGTFHFEEGTYRFYAKVDDGVRVYVDGERIINGWRNGTLRRYTADRAMEASDHTITVEYYDYVQIARGHVWWEKIAGPTPTDTPTPTPEPCATATPTSTPEPCETHTPAPEAAWYGEFFNNRGVSGTPAVTRYDPWIGFDWGTGSPAGIPNERFSARWTRKMHLDTDHYRFCAMSDDGVRIWVDDELVLDEWHANNGVAYCGAYWAQSGTYNVKVEYYEDGGDALIYVWTEPH
jgi:LysM repeat protein